MKQFILVLMLVIIASTETVKPATDQCACTKIMSQADCQTVSTCSWTPAVAATATTAAIVGSCGAPTTPITPVVATAHCPQVAVPATNCWKTLGCAYVDSKCTHFTGCTAYVKTTNSDCQAISSLCITDGTQCTDAKSCNEYTTETMCSANASISGIKKCKWDNNACRDFVCSEADSTLASNTTCSAWLSGCLTTGKGCTLTLGACASYTGDDVACSGLKGTDGNCEGTVGGTNCIPRVCSKASNTVVTDADCSTYQGGCITNGKGCVTSPLPACATYLGENTTCVGYVGSDGTCEGDAGATNCRARICTNAPASNNTDILCIAYKTGCVTNGKGCVTSKATCAGYSGTTTSCVGYIGTDGYCKGTNATTSSPCAAKVCSDAPTTTSTDAACISYQLGCKSTGKGCIGVLGLCSGYSGTTVTCEGYVGSDGKCKGTSVDTAGSCTLKICIEAPSSTTTNEACASYQTGCLTTGSGCVALAGCLDTIKSISCTGSSGCGWNSICVSSQYCSSFLTTSICNGNKAILIVGGSTTITPCFWTGTQCRDLACTDAPTINNTDALCGTFLTGCLTKGNGCFAPSVACTSYVGTKGTCSAFTAKCWNTDAAIATTNCTIRVCTDDVTSTTDSACDSFKTGCRTKGVGCVDGTNACTTYTGLQATCDTFKQVVGSVTTPCYNASAALASTPCTVKQCSDNITATSNADCDIFLTGCLTKGLGCVTPGTACNSYTGTQAICGNFKGSSGVYFCWNATSAAATTNCKNKECSDAPIATITDSDCGSFLSGCLTNGVGCVTPSTPCTSYQGNLTQCSAFTGNSLKCYNQDTCGIKLCADKLNPTNNDDCKNYLSSCRFFNATCITGVSCATYATNAGTTLALCQDVLDTSNAKCWWTSGATCISRSCQTVPNTITNQAGCDAHILGCVYAGTGLCALKGACTYTANGSTATDKLANCQAMVDTNNKACFYTAGVNCESKICTNVPGTITGIGSCDAHVSGCRYNGVSCVTADTCANYVIAGTDAEKLTRCQNMTDSSNKSCWWVTGGNCQSRTCATATAAVPIAQATCDAHISNACGFQNSCIRLVCQLKINATTNANCTTHDSLCRFNGNAMCIASQALCTSYVIDSTVTALSTKQTICNDLTTTAAGKCSFSGTGQTCVARTCAGKTDAASIANCTDWLSTCRWVGGTSTCVTATADCVYTVSGAQTCALMTNSAATPLGCQDGASATACVARTCGGKTNAASIANCTDWLSTCRWVGGTSTCVAATADCVYTVSGAQTCVLMTNSAATPLGCQIGVAPACVARTCGGKTNAASIADCTGWLSTCRWVGGAASTCVAATADCVYTVSQQTCALMTDSAATPLGCQDGASATACVAKTCGGKTNAASIADCTGWLSTCRWVGAATCVAATADCVYTVSGAQTCALMTDSAATPLGCQIGVGSACVARTCGGKTNAASIADCTGWLSTCRWVGAATCVAATTDCVYTVSGAQTCALMTDSAATPLGCQIGVGSACVARTCGGKTDAASIADCTGWLSTCRWVGAATCVAATNDCVYTVSGAQTCALMTDSAATPLGCKDGVGSACVARTCGGKTDAASIADCTGWLSTCRWVGAATCVAATTDCVYTVSGAQTCALMTNSAATPLGCQIGASATACVARTCGGKTNAASIADCTGWLSTCRWVGGTSTCVAATADCVYTVSGAQTCALMTDSAATPLGCQDGASATACVARTCGGKTNAASIADCTGWLSTCRWVGGAASTCVAATADCVYTISRQTCALMTNSAATPLGCQDGASATACVARTCGGKTNAASITDCTGWLSTCRWVGGTSTCVAATADCVYTVSGAQTCALMTNSAATPQICQDGASATACVARTCGGKTNAASITDCTGWLSTCRWVGGTSTCVAATADCVYTVSGAQTCALMTDSAATPLGCQNGASTTACVARTCGGKTDSTSHIDCNTWKTGCQWTGVSTGVTCALPDTCSNCEARTCSNIQITPTTNQNCIDWLSTCRFTGTYCVPQVACTAYQVSGTNTANQTLCEGITNASGVLCAYLSGAAACSDRSCPLVSTVAQSNCIAWLGTSCRWDGLACKTGGTCNSYSPTGITDDLKKTYCNGLTNIAVPPLACGWSSGLNCIERDCTNVFPAPATDSDCKTFLSTCRLTNTGTASCIVQTSVCLNYTGTAAQCKTFSGVNDTTPCWSIAADSAVAAACIDKQCTHNTTATTNAECNSFLPTCKTNGLGCVASTTPCSSFEGNTATCALRLSAIGTDTCKVGPSISDACTIKSCTDDGNSTTDASCQSFMSTCLTRGTGCVLKTAPCSVYQGTQATCGSFTGNLKKCWNIASAISTSFCIEKKCSDDEISTTDTACNSSLNGCVTKGTGCIENSATCGAYQGTQATCSAFKVNSVSLCWNLSTALVTTPCIEKACIHNASATSDTDCETFLPRGTLTIPKCVTSGTGCVDYPRACSGFTGTLEQCGKFTATDGPCKTTATGSILASGTCTPRICTEALNSNNTDALCNTYYKGCVTTGYGCVTSVNCSTIQEMSSCSAKTGCSWVNNCRSVGTDCSSLTSFGASICKNTPVSTGSKKCSWYNSNTCRAQTCDDLPATLVSHDSCKAIIDTCTTTGTGCTTMTTCSGYATEVICKAAKTTNIGDTCIWDTSACRAKKCTDAPTGTTTDAGCDTFLTGCKTNGASCVSSVLCSTLITASACQVDGSSNPCLFVNSLCYSYAKCEDAIMTTHSACQQFSPLCTTNGAKCIAISSCAKTVNQISCVLGTDGACGWLPVNGANAAKCQKFGVCSDALATDTASCAGYGSNCITDGTKCIDKSTCSTYLTAISCDFGGTDGVCQFTSGSSCRLRECTDASAANASGGITSHSGCYGFTAKNKCTTNGTSCIAFQACASYSVEAGCAEGIDGVCIYALPAGVTTGTISCRVKVCGDFALATSATCSVALTGAGLGAGCVSNGTICIVKALCSSYVSKEACNGGGSDGQCAFSPGSTTTPNVGTCKLMSTCTDANNDSTACNNNSAACKWVVTTSGATTTTACNAQTCTTKASGSTCNPVPSFDLKTYTVCGPATSGCTEVAGNTLLATTCQLYTLKTFTWDETNSKCVSCFTTITPNPDPGTGGGTTTTTDGNIIKSLATLVILAIMVA